MRIGSSIALIVIGAIVAFAVDYQIAGIDLRLIGYILMAAGVVGEGAACRAVYARVICKKYKKHYGDWRD